MLVYFIGYSNDVVYLRFTILKIKNRLHKLFLDIVLVRTRKVKIVIVIKQDLLINQVFSI